MTPIIPVLVGDDWKAALLWRALYDAGVFTNCALHPAVPPGGALLRTSVMATHDRATLDRALDVFAASSATSRPSTARCRGRRELIAAACPARPRRGPSGRRGTAATCPNLHKSAAQRKRSLLAHEAAARQLTGAPALT